jgi:hypothetical protein
MAIHTDTEIFSTVRRLFVKVSENAERFPKGAKPLLGQPMIERCLEVMTLIRRANCARDEAKIPHLEQLLEKNDEIEALLRVCVERSHISRGQYGDAIQLTQSVGRQATGWRKASSNSPVARPSRQPGPRDLQPGRAADPQGHRHAR